MDTKADHPLYYIWTGIKTRCFDEGSLDYWKYGGVGVTLHPEWRASLQVFAEYMGERPSPRHSIDRYPDKHGSYVPGNVRWATPEQQGNNRRPNRPKESTPKMPSPKNKSAFQKLLKKYTKARIAEMAGLTRQAITSWEAVPVAHVIILSEKTGIPPENILPDPCEDCQNPFCPKNQSPT